MSKPERKSNSNRTTELKALIDRFPVPGRGALTFTLACIVLGNGYVLWQIWQGDLSLSGLILLVLSEGILLSVLEAMQRARIPQSHRMRYEIENLSLPQKAISWIAFVFSIGGAYALWIWLLKETDVFITLVTTWQAWRDSGLDVALGITLAFAVAGMFADHRHYQRAGPPLVSTVSMEAMTRRITFGYGAIVIAIPLFGLFALATLGIRRAFRDLGEQWNFIGGVTVLAAYFGIFFLLAHTVDSGPRGWACVYLLGKIFVESLFALLPLLARRAQAKPA